MSTTKANALFGKKILITSGPTWVSIDPMRVISNRATGELGQALTVALAKLGAKVTLLEGPVTKPLTASKVTIKKFCFYNELKTLLTTELKKNYDVIIHNAAVSDYQLKKPSLKKIDSIHRTLTLTLIPTEKLINTIKLLSPKIFLVGFKLEDFKNEKQVLAETKKLISLAHCDLVVANTLKGGYKATLLDNNAKILNSANSRLQLSNNLIAALKEKLL